METLQRKGSGKSFTSSSGTRTTRGGNSRFKKWRQRWLPDSAIYIVASNAASVVAFLLLGIIVLVLALFIDSNLYGHYKLSRQDNEIQRLNDLIISDLLFAAYTKDSTHFSEYIEHDKAMATEVADILTKLPPDVVERYRAHDADRTQRQEELQLLARALVYSYSEKPTASTVQGFLDQIVYLRDKGVIGIINNYIEQVYEDDIRVSRVLVIISSIVAFCAIPLTIFVSIVTLILDYKQKQKLMTVQSHFLHETLHDEKERERFIAFCKKEFSAENVLCWIEIAEYKQMDNNDERYVKASRIYETYLAPNATEPVNIDGSAANEIKRTIALSDAKKTEIKISLFDALQQELETNMQDTHSRYKKFKNGLITGNTSRGNELNMFKLTNVDSAPPTHASLELHANRPTSIRNSGDEKRTNPSLVGVGAAPAGGVSPEAISFSSTGVGVIPGLRLNEESINE